MKHLKTFEKLSEGDNKYQNKKYGGVICNDCGHKADGFDFQRAFRKGLRCPKCKSKNVDDNMKRPTPVPAPQTIRKTKGQD